MPSATNPITQITVHALWPCAPENVATALSPESWARLPAYITRYARTLGVPVVHAVGGADDHLHLLFDLPVDKTVNSITGELQTATARFLRDTLGASDFAWSATYAAWSVGASERDEFAAYVTGNAAHHVSGTTWPEWEWEGAGDASADGGEVETPKWLHEAIATERRHWPSRCC